MGKNISSNYYFRNRSIKIFQPRDSRTMGSNIEIIKATVEKISGNHGCFSAQLFIGSIIFSSIQSFIKSNPLVKIPIHNSYQNSTLKYGCYSYYTTIVLLIIASLKEQGSSNPAIYAHRIATVDFFEIIHSILFLLTIPSCMVIYRHNLHVPLVVDGSSTYLF